MDLSKEEIFLIVYETSNEALYLVHRPAGYNLVNGDQWGASATSEDLQRLEFFCLPSALAHTPPSLVPMFTDVVPMFTDETPVGTADRTGHGNYEGDDSSSSGAMCKSTQLGGSIYRTERLSLAPHAH